MRRLVIATTLAAALAPLAAIEASAASAIVKQRHSTHALGCAVTSAGFIDVRNTTKQTIPRGAEIALVIVVNGTRTYGLRKTVTAKQALSPNLVHAFPMPSGATSCSASVKLLPNVMRR